MKHSSTISWTHPKSELSFSPVIPVVLKTESYRMPGVIIIYMIWSSWGEELATIVYCLVSDVLCLMSGVLCLVSDVWCLMSGALCLLCPAERAVGGSGRLEPSWQLSRKATTPVGNHWAGAGDLDRTNSLTAGHHFRLIKDPHLKL